MDNYQQWLEHMLHFTRQEYTIEKAAGNDAAADRFLQQYHAYNRALDAFKNRDEL